MRQKELADMKVTKLKKKDGKADAQSLSADATQAYDDTEVVTIELLCEQLSLRRPKWLSPPREQWSPVQT